MKQLPKRGSQDYFKVVGLLTIADGHRKSVDLIERSLCDVLGERYEDYGHISDAIWSGYTADKLLDKLRARREVDAKRKNK